MIHLVNPKIQVFGAPDSGFFIDYVNIKTKDNDFKIIMKSLLKISN